MDTAALTERLSSLRTELLSGEDFRLLLTECQNLFGRRPEMLMLGSLTIRWIESDDDIVEILAYPKAHEVGDGLGVAWRVRVRHGSYPDIIHAERLTLEYARDDPWYRPPYIWDVPVAGHRAVEAPSVPILTWDMVEKDVGRAVSELPATLAALPAEWFDGANELAFMFRDYDNVFRAIASPGVLWLDVGVSDGTRKHVYSYVLDAAACLASDVGQQALALCTFCFQPPFPVRSLRAELVSSNPHLFVWGPEFEDVCVDVRPPDDPLPLATFARWSRTPNYDLDAPSDDAESTPPAGVLQTGPGRVMHPEIPQLVRNHGVTNPWSRTPRTFTASRTLGAGEACFLDAVERLMTWQVQGGSGFDVEPATRVTQGADHVVSIKMGGLRLRAPVRIREVISTVENGWQRRGFLYETRPGHPENGRESFVVERHFETDEVRFVITATARPGRWWVWLGAPVARVAQDVATRRYLRAIQPTSGE